MVDVETLKPLQCEPDMVFEGANRRSSIPTVYRLFHNITVTVSMSWPCGPPGKTVITLAWNVFRLVNEMGSDKCEQPFVVRPYTQLPDSVDLTRSVVHIPAFTLHYGTYSLLFRVGFSIPSLTR